MSIDIPGSPRRDGSLDSAAIDLFLSYNRRDCAEVQQVRKLLGARGISVFIDQENPFVGFNWFEALQQALGRVRGVVIFLGPNGLGGWQRREIALALVRQTSEEKRGVLFPVIPVLLPGSQEDDYSGFLLLNTYADLRGGLGRLDAIVDAVRHPATGENAPTISLCPYRGLNAFREEYASLFFGRDRLVDEPEQGLLHKVLTCPLVAVVGASGSGKSSVVQAGLLPRLRRQPSSRGGTWDAVVFRPERSPFLKLAIALEAALNPEKTDNVWMRNAADLSERWSSDRIPLELSLRGAAEALRVDRLLVVVDQFEELITLTPQDDRRPFLSRLLAATGAESKITVLLTLRADYYAAIYLDPRLSDGFRRGLVDVGAMTLDERREVIEGPARLVGLEFEPGLVEQLLGDMGDEPGNLPLLEFTLTELWERREGRRLTNAAYRALGGVAGAIGRRAEVVYAGLQQEQQDAAPQLFGRLVQVMDINEEGRDTCRRVRLGDLNEASRSVVEPFVVGRLLVTARATGRSAFDANPDKGSAPSAPDDLATVEVAHEALIHEWDRLRGWIRENRAFLHWRQGLGFQIAEWERFCRDSAYLYSGIQLAVARKWANEHRHELNPLEADFLEASVSDAIRRAEETKAKNQWMRVLIGITAVFLLSMPVAAIFVPGMLATSLANKQLEDLASAAQGVASTVLSELERLSEPVLKAADSPELQRLLKGDDLRRLQNYANNLYLQNVKPKGNRYFDYYSIYIQRDGFILGVSPKNIAIIGNDYSGRDYYIGAMRCRREKGKASFHISRVFQAENDNYYKFAISAPVHENGNPGSPPLGVIAATIATTPTLGSLQLNNPWLTAVLVDRRDPNPPRGPLAPDSKPPEYLIVVHPAYLSPGNPIKVDKNSLRFPPEQPMNRDYRDPLAAQNLRMLAGFAPVGNTELLVIVQQRYDEAIEPVVTRARSLILWGGIFLSLGTIITGAIMGYGVPIATEKKTTNLA